MFARWHNDNVGGRTLCAPTNINNNLACIIITKYAANKVRGDDMEKKTKDFFILPLTQILVMTIGLTVIIWPEANILIGIIIYIAAGRFFSKIESKKIKISSAAVAALIIAAACVAVFISMESGNRDAGYAFFSISPFTFLFFNLTYDFPLIFTLLCSVCPILVTVLSAKFFDIKDKRAKEQ